MESFVTQNEIISVVSSKYICWFFGDGEIAIEWEVVVCVLGLQQYFIVSLQRGAA
jgi:hypothetical protein